MTETKKYQIELLRYMRFGGCDYDRTYWLTLTDEEVEYLLKNGYIAEDEGYEDTIFVYPDDSDVKVWLDKKKEEQGEEPVQDFDELFRIYAPCWKKDDTKNIWVMRAEAALKLASVMHASNIYTMIR